MKKDIILELMNGETPYIDKVYVDNIPEYQKCLEKYEKLLNKLCENMPEDEKRKVLHDLDFEQSGILCVYADEFFKAGFKLGLTLGAQNFLD